MTESAKYVRIVEWSEEDQCFAGHCPGVIGPCCHGDDEVAVYQQLCGIVEERIDIAKRDNKPLPPSTAGKGVAAKILASISGYPAEILPD
jgi:hypothetical protein